MDLVLRAFYQCELPALSVRVEASLEVFIARGLLFRALREALIPLRNAEIYYDFRG